MKPTEQTLKQIERAIRKIADKYPYDENTSLITDIHLRASQDSGELMAFDDDGHEVTRCLVDEWVDNNDEDFNSEAIGVLRSELRKEHDVVDNLGIMKPYSFVFEDEDGEHLDELYVADDDTMIIGDDLLKDFDDDLDNFFDKLMKE